MCVNFAGKRICVRSENNKTTTYFYKNWCGYEIEIERCECIGTQYRFLLTVRRLDVNILHTIEFYKNMHEAVQYCFNIIYHDTITLEKTQNDIVAMLLQVKQEVDSYGG